MELAVWMRKRRTKEKRATKEMDETRRGDVGWRKQNVDRNVTRIDERIGYYEKGKGWQRRSAAIVFPRRYTPVSGSLFVLHGRLDLVKRPTLASLSFRLPELSDRSRKN